MTFRMAPKKSKLQGSGKEATMADVWKKSRLSEAEISSLVSCRLLQSQALIQWRSAEGHQKPFEKTAETALFKQFVERGLSIPVCDFLRGLLFFWGIQLHHLTPSSYFIFLSSPISVRSRWKRQLKRCPPRRYQDNANARSNST